MHYLYDGQMPVMEQEFEDGVLQQTRVHLLGGRGIEAVVAIDHTQGNSATLSWLLYDGHGNWVRTMAPDYTLSGWQFRGVWGEVQGNLALGRGYCANLGHPEDETGLVYMRARYYEPATGRFISEDPSRDGVNWYLYADGNPVNKVDADGKESIPYMRLLSGIAAGIYAFLALWGIGPAQYAGAITATLAWAKEQLLVARVLFVLANAISRFPTPRPEIQLYAMSALMAIGVGITAATVVTTIAALHSLVIYFIVQSTEDYIQAGNQP